MEFAVPGSFVRCCLLGRLQMIPFTKLGTESSRCVWVTWASPALETFSQMIRLCANKCTTLLLRYEAAICRVLKTNNLLASIGCHR